ncbi:hypothetical protein ACHWQZ_G002594 [Mnemiopsis leidyi]
MSKFLSLLLLSLMCLVFVARSEEDAGEDAGDDHAEKEDSEDSSEDSSAGIFHPSKPLLLAALSLAPLAARLFI